MGEGRLTEGMPAARGERAVRILYVDLDGTIRHGFDELGRFVNGPEDVVIFDGVCDKLVRYKRAGWRIAGISNQGGIALGHVTSEDVAAAMLRTHQLCAQAFDKIAWCMHHPAAKDPEMARCICRKPRAGLVFEVSNALAEASRIARCPEYYPPHLALFVGDRPEDAGCADAANIDFMDAREWRERGEP